MKEAIQNIRKQCRLAMNGIASTSMRERGLDYKLNFGLMQAQLKAIAGEYVPNKELAAQLWAEETRELKILATLLYPHAEFTPDEADKWANTIPNQEIREQVCMNLFRHLPYASIIGLSWAKADSEGVRTTGYWLLVRLFLDKKVNELIQLDDLPHVWADAVCNELFLRQASLSVLKHIGRVSKENAENILKMLANYKGAANPIEQEAYNSLAFEFEYFHGV